MSFRLGRRGSKGHTVQPGADSAASLLTILFLLFISLSTAITTHALECSYLAEGADEELSAKGDCGEMIDPDRFLIHEEHLKSLSFIGGLAVVFVDDKVFYVSKEGKTVRTWMVDNGADYFSEGLARTVSEGKFGYIDEKLDLVIPPRYDFAFPFESGLAVVCNGCNLKQVDEHLDVEEGMWGAIDRSGRVLIPLEHSRTGLMNIINENFRR